MSKTNTKTAAAPLKVKAVGDERKVTFVVSSGREDRDRERVDVKSLRVPLKGGGYVLGKDLDGSQAVDVPWLLNHSFDVEDVIGSVRVATYDAANDELIYEFGVSSRSKAQDMLTLIEEGHLDNAVSITMSDYTFDAETQTIFDAEMIEVSLVFRGSNKDARLLSVKSLGKGERMGQPTLAEKKAELERLSKEIETEEAATPTQVETPEVTPAVEEPAQPAADEPATPVAPVQDEPVTPVAPEAPAPAAPESKSVKQELPKVDNTATKQIKDVPTQPVTPVVKAADEKMDKVELTAKQFSAWVRGDRAELTALNEKALATFDAKSKATYMNTGVTADGGAIVPSNELLTDVFTTLSNYSTVANDLRVITLTEGNGIDVATLVTDVIVAEVTTEGGNKPVTKPTLGDGEISLREFAGIAIITKKLVRQAAVNVYDLLRESFARAIANQRAVMALTDATSGIANKAGVVEVPTAAGQTTVEEVTYDTIRKMPYSLPVAAVPGSKYYFSRELVEVLDGLKDADGRDLDLIRLDGDGLSGSLKNGFRFAVEEVLGKSGAPHAVFGNMGRYGILLRQGTLESETFDTGTVVDGSSVSHNLLQQNKLAHRVAFYENVGYPLPGAFAKLVLATV